MFISHRYRVIFIHIQRTGGYSIHDIFRQYDPDLVETVAIDPAKQRIRHCHAGDIRAALGADTFAQYRKFCVVRHPYTRMLSWYQVLRKGYAKSEPRMKAEMPALKIYQHGIHYLNRRPNAFKSTLADGWTRLFRLLGAPDAVLRGEHTGNRVLVEVNRHAHNFSEFLRLPRDGADGLFERFHATQLDYLSEQGEVLVDEVLHFERLADDFAAFAQKIEFPGALPHLNKSQAVAPENDAQDFDKQLIRERFARDFEYFGYSTDF